MTGFAGDPGHEGSTKPMMSLKGGMSGVNTQQPMAGENDMNRRASNDSPFIGWDDTSIGSGMRGGDTNNASSDSKGVRTPPSHQHG